MYNYINKYEERKAEMENVLFPHRDDLPSEGGYGTLFGSVYPSAMLEFDRQELLTYRMILENMYANYGYSNIDAIFEE